MDKFIHLLKKFVQTMNSHINRVTKDAPNKVTKKDVPHLLSFNTIASEKLVRRPKFRIGGFVRISADLRFRKVKNRHLPTKCLKFMIFQRKTLEKAFLETELSSRRTAKNSWLVCQGYYYEDETAKIDGADNRATDVAARKNLVADSLDCFLLGKPPSDILTGDKHLIFLF